MKLLQFGTLLLAASLAFTSCKKADLVSDRAAGSDAASLETSASWDQSTGSWENTNAYTVKLESHVANNDGTWTWTWSIQNPNPGNGNNGTIQALSHWSMSLGSCINFLDIVGASTSMNGNNFSNFTPTLQVDPSQSCVITPVLKFNVSTSGSAKTYCRLIVKGDYQVATAAGFYKSGARTGCGPLWFQGIGCVGGFDN
ncbi:hypothetical protein [Flaviaesturariibacter terrae]